MLGRCWNKGCKKEDLIWDKSAIEKPEIGLVILYKVRFILRCNKNYKLIDPKVRSLKAWECTRGKRSIENRMIHDARRRCERKTGIVFLLVRVPDFPNFPLTLVSAHQRAGLFCRGCLAYRLCLLSPLAN